MKKTSKNASQGMALGMCFGLSIGTALGSGVFHNLSLGMCTGMALGMCLGAALGAAKDKEMNAQIESEGYRVAAVNGPNADRQYEVTIVGKDGASRVIMVDPGTMDDEAFKVGDVVYLDEEGGLEQAYEEEE